RRTLDGLGRGRDREPVLLRLLPAVALADADHHVVAGVLEVERVRATLAPIADHGDPGALQGLLVDVLLRIRAHLKLLNASSESVSVETKNPAPERVRCGVPGVRLRLSAFRPGPRTSGGEAAPAGQ